MVINMRYAIIDNTTNEVLNLIVADSEIYLAPNQFAVALNDDERCEIGQTYSESDSPRFSGTPKRLPMSWTAYQFLLRFTESELEIIRGRSFTDATVWRFLTLAEAAHEINSDDPTTIAGMDYLVSASILTQARRDEILAV
jgi:hypothetical protein